MAKLKKNKKYYNRFSVLFKKPDLSKIRRMTFSVTNLCNSRCQMCNIWQIAKSDRNLIKRELSLDHINNLLDSKYLKGLEMVGLTGGEPFLRKDIVDICTLFGSRYPGISISINTNGLNSSLICKTVGAIIVKNPDLALTIAFSIDGTREIHDRVRGVPGGYDRTMETLKNIKSTWCIPLAFSHTITSDNFLTLKEVYSLSKKLGIGFTVRFAQTSQNYYGNSGMDFIWRPEILEKIANELKEIAEDMKHNMGLIKRFFSPYPYFISSIVDYQRNPKRNFPCYAGVDSFYLTPVGGVIPCIMLDKPIGNIQESSFDEIWSSRNAFEARKYINSKKCHCWTECEVCYSLQYHAFSMLFKCLNSSIKCNSK